MWLHEGFGTYMQPLYMQWRGGEMPYDADLWKLRSQIPTRHPMVSGRQQLEEEVYDDETGPGHDIYYKAALMLHTLRAADRRRGLSSPHRRAWFTAAPTRGPAISSRASAPLPSSSPSPARKRTATLRWFFNAYFYQARLPRLVETRNGNTLFLQWRTPKGIPFPMPLDVAVDGKTVTVSMTGGHGSVPLPALQPLGRRPAGQGAAPVRRHGSLRRLGQSGQGEGQAKVLTTGAS